MGHFLNSQKTSTHSKHHWCILLGLSQEEEQKETSLDDLKTNQFYGSFLSFSGTFVCLFSPLFISLLYHQLNRALLWPTWFPPAEGVSTFLCYQQLPRALFSSCIILLPRPYFPSPLSESRQSCSFIFSHCGQSTRSSKLAFIDS